MRLLKIICLVVIIAAVAPAFGQIQLPQDRYTVVLDSIKPLPKITAVDIYAEYEKNGVVWEGKYTGTFRILTGNISNIGRDVLGIDRVISLKTRSEVIKGVPGYHTIDVLYPETLPENIKKTLSAYKVGQNVELFVRFRKTPDSVHAVYYDEALPREYSIQIYKDGDLYVIVPNTDIGKIIAFKDKNGKMLAKHIINNTISGFPNLSVPDDTDTIEVGNFVIKKSEIK